MFKMVWEFATDKISQNFIWTQFAPGAIWCGNLYKVLEIATLDTIHDLFLAIFFFGDFSAGQVATYPIHAEDDSILDAAWFWSFKALEVITVTNLWGSGPDLPSPPEKRPKRPKRKP